VRYTCGGDANLDSVIDGDDFFAIDSGYASQTRGYANGDFDYNGRTDADDYFLIDSNYGKAQLASAAFAESELPAADLVARDTLSVYAQFIEETETALW